MAKIPAKESSGSLKGTIYGDLVGSPFMIDNTYNRYFELGEDRRAYVAGKVRNFFPSPTEVSYGCSSVCQWLVSNREKPTVERLRECLLHEYERHPRGGWTQETSLSLLSGEGAVSQTPDWSAAARTLPIASYIDDSLERVLELAEACVRATCANQEAVEMGKALSHAAFMASHGSDTRQIQEAMEREYRLDLRKNDDDARAELRGEVRRPLVMMGQPVEGAYHYVHPDYPQPPSARTVTEAAMKAVLGSDSWEDAVRRAVSYGGPSNGVAGMAGGLAEALYGEVTPKVLGKLYTKVPTDLIKAMEAFDRRNYVKVDRDASAYGSISRDAVQVIDLGLNRYFIVDDEKAALKKSILQNMPDALFLTAEEARQMMASYKAAENDTYPYGEMPEMRTLYVQEGKALVSPSYYVASGMPPLQVREHHRKEFLEFREWCMDRQREMNRFAGNPEGCQIHYADAYHMLIGSSRVDFMMGDQHAGALLLDEKGLLKVELGEYRDLGLDARFENHTLQSWSTRSLFSVEDTVNPIARMDNIRDEVRSRLLDEGVQGAQISNLDRLVKLDENQISRWESTAQPAGSPRLEDVGLDIGRLSRQPVNTIFSIGYGRRSLENFLNTLQMAGIDTVVDLRSCPSSRTVPHFNEENIYPTLKEIGISYLSAGEKLGARFPSQALKDENGRVDWEKVMSETDYRAAISSVESLSREGHMVAVVCSEGNPLVCHRFGLISRSLSGDGFEMKHILANGEVASQAQLEDRLLERYVSRNMIPSVVSGSYSQQLHEAYKAMNSEFGYKPAGKAQGKRMKWFKM